MTGVEIFFYLAVGWFSFVCLRIAVLIRRFIVFPKKYGRISNVPLTALAQAAAAKGQDLPCFRVVIPAYREALVIDGTLRRLAAQNYPQTHFEAIVVTYADEVAAPGEETTFAVASRIAEQINAEADVDFVQVLSVPATFDGEFPGTMDADRQFIGKSRGLNFALRSIHEENEDEERSFHIGRMSRLGRIDAIDKALDALALAIDAGPDEAASVIGAIFDPRQPGFLGSCVLSRQVVRLNDCLALARRRLGARTDAVETLLQYNQGEAARFFLNYVEGAGQDAARLEVMADRRFLYDKMRVIEARPLAKLEEASRRTEHKLALTRPRLHEAIGAATNHAQLFQLARQIGSRWVAVYDADADPPIELFRHLAADILNDPGIMGFQGPVAPVANYDDVHPLCRLGGLWMGFWHATGYPRMMSHETWAHVLAGTNWCFRIEGFKEGDHLIPMADYDESKRQFLLSFDPRQLTEDLEVAVRVFSDWHVNAVWHPFTEYEQVPAKPSDMIVQRRRWTLGTLQTLSTILRSRLPLLQKLKYALLPLDIVFSGSGPIVTIALWILVYGGDLLNNPVLVAWSVVLTFGNLVYLIPYLLAHERFVIGYRRATSVDYILDEGRDLANLIHGRLKDTGVSAQDAEYLRHIAISLEIGAAPDGFVHRYLTARSLEQWDDSNIQELLHATPAAVRSGADRSLAAEFAALADWASRPAASSAVPDAALTGRLSRLATTLEKAACRGVWRQRRRQERWQILRWAFVYLFWQLIPYYSGLFVWLAGRNTRNWVKTPRTRKDNLTPDE